MISRRWAWVASLALLFAGVTNAHAHVHLCLDGQEPPTSVHLSDTNGHHDGFRLVDHADGHGHHGNHGSHGVDLDHGDHSDRGDHSDHDDVDLDIANPALAKTVKHDCAAIAQAWRKGQTLSPLRADAPADARERHTASATPYLHPPLRAPPL